MSFQVLADYANVCGEGPLWHAAEKRVYWGDIPTGRLFRYDPATGQHELVYHDRPVGGYTIQADGSLLLFRDRGNVVMWRDGQVVKTIIEEVPELTDTRFNDVVADPEGRVFCGTMSSKTIKGRLHRLDLDGSLHVLLTDQGTPNGMGFSPDLSKMYYNDSNKATTWLFDYDRKSGAIANQRVFRDAKASGDRGRQDGLVVDSEGHVWTARWDGSCVLRFDPFGEPAGAFDLPCPNVTSLIFGGDRLDQLYVTSAGGDKKDQHGPHAGALFRLDGHGATGQTEFLSRVGL
jgi:sugar lactone lactonase YvrE